MYVVKMSSGFGNQLFQYAFALYLKEHGKGEVFLDKSAYRYHTPNRKCAIDIISDIPTIKDRRIYYHYKSVFFHISKFLFDLNPFVKRITESNLLFPIKGRYLYFDGYWQTNFFIQNVKNWEAYFQPKEPMPNTISDLAAQMSEGHSISMHVRRGDYFSKAFESQYGVCDVAYYEKALEYLTEGLDHFRLFVLSDDPNWVSENIHLPAQHVLIKNEAINPYWYIWLMSQCRDHILSNSSFSWWGAYMGKHPQKRVVAPKTWIKGQQQTIALPEWIQL
jgi:hypothetical protein